MKEEQGTLPKLYSFSRRWSGVVVCCLPDCTMWYWSRPRAGLEATQDSASVCEVADVTKFGLNVVLDATITCAVRISCKLYVWHYLNLHTSVRVGLQMPISAQAGSRCDLALSSAKRGCRLYSQRTTCMTWSGQRSDVLKFTVAGCYLFATGRTRTINTEKYVTIKPRNM